MFPKEKKSLLNIIHKENREPLMVKKHKMGTHSKAKNVMLLGCMPACLIGCN
jgi:hypothetical protein